MSGDMIPAFFLGGAVMLVIAAVIWGPESPQQRRNKHKTQVWNAHRLTTGEKPIPNAACSECDGRWGNVNEDKLWKSIPGHCGPEEF